MPPIAGRLLLPDMAASLVLRNAWKLALTGGVAFAASWVAVRQAPK